MYFEKCWPNAELIESFDFKRLVEIGDEVLVTYESTKTDGQRFRNTEIHTFEGDQICQVEVYFGWDLPDSRVVAGGAYFSFTDRFSIRVFPFASLA